MLWHSIVSCSDPSASSNLSTVFHVLQAFYHLLLRLHFFSTCKRHVLCTPIILFSPAPTLVLLHIIHVLQLFNISCSHCSASPHVSQVRCAAISYSLLLRPKCFCTSISNVPCTLIILLSPTLTSVLPHMHESSHMCSDILLSPALTPVFLHMHKPCPVCSDILFSPAPIPVLLHIYPQYPQ